MLLLIFEVGFLNIRRWFSWNTMLSMLLLNSLVAVAVSLLLIEVKSARFVPAYWVWRPVGSVYMAIGERGDSRLPF